MVFLLQKKQAFFFFFSFLKITIFYYWNYYFFQLLFPEFKCYSKTARTVCRQSGGTAAEGFSAFVSRPWWRHHWVQPAINSVMRSSCIHPFISSSSAPTFCFLTFTEGSEDSVFCFPNAAYFPWYYFCTFNLVNSRTKIARYSREGGTPKKFSSCFHLTRLIGVEDFLPSEGNRFQSDYAALAPKQSRLQFCSSVVW